MRCVTRPIARAGQTFSQCISRIQDTDLKRRLESVKPDIRRAAASYARRAGAQALHKVLPTADVAGIVSADEMKALYDRRMAGARGPGRPIYNDIKDLPEDGICPLCGHGIVSTLDHVLPKTSFPALAVAPDNLVGACKDCNFEKKAQSSSASSATPLHPYFDDVSTSQWLEAQVLQGRVPVVLFRTASIPHWPNDLNERVAAHFAALKLGHMYTKQATREISGQRGLLQGFFDAGGAPAVLAELKSKAKSWDQHNLNCWQAACFRAMADSSWYCGGGFAQR